MYFISFFVFFFSFVHIYLKLLTTIFYHFHCRLDSIESLIDQFSLKIKTVLTVLPESNRFLSNLSLLSPHIKFTEKVLNPLKFNSEILATKTKSTIIEILNLKINSENENLNDSFSEENFLQKNVPLQTRTSLKDFVFLFSTFKQLLDSQKKENLVEIIPLKVRK